MLSATTTAHFIKRAEQRSVGEDDLELALSYGRRLHASGTLYVFVGRRDVQQMRQQGLRKVDRLEGLTLVLDPKSKTLITCFKNRQFPKWLRRYLGRR